MVIVSYAPLAVRVNGYMCSMSWSSVGGERLHLHIPVILLRHLFKIFFLSNFTSVAYLSRLTLQPTSHKGARMSTLSIRLGSVADLLA